MNNALIVVDVQNDFCEGGALEVPGANKIIPIINRLILSKEISVLALTKDWHPKNHCSFELGGISWLRHCVQGTKGAERHDALLKLESIDKLNWYRGGTIIWKGTNKDFDSYSGFFNTPAEPTYLKEYLDKKCVDNVYVCGLALDVCVKATALDAVKEGFNTYVILDACKAAPVQPIHLTIQELQDGGAHCITSHALL